VKRATKELLYFEIGPDNPPTLDVDSGEPFEVETQMNAGPWLDAHPDGERLRQKITGGNPSSGCIRVRGAEPGQMLSVSIGDIHLSGTGFTRFRGSTGAMPGYLGSSAIGEHSRVVSIRDNMIIWDDNTTLPAKPMLGFVGVAPANERYHNGWGGHWGGNMDIQELCPGATVHLPVYLPGALVHIGDMHAIQGDGEICGAGGIESEGIVQVTCSLGAKPESMDYPRIENDTHIIAMGMARPAEDAFRMALANLITWMEEDYGFSRPDAFLLLGQVMEARCTQFVNPTFTYVAKIAKEHLARRP
jgi:amidase